jgi:glutathione peroxidase
MNHILKPANFSPLLLAIAASISLEAALIAQDQPQSEGSVAAASVEKGSLLDVKLPTIDGREVDLSVHKGKVIVVVNTASKCGFTSQYKKLEKIHQQYHEQGLVVLGFPSNQFGEQEPGDNEQIAQFCKKNYGVTFDLFAKSNVKGDQQNDLFRMLCSYDLKPKGKGEVSWNFEKFIIGRKGHPVARFPARVSPTDAEFATVLKQELAKGTPAEAEEN